MCDIVIWNVLFQSILVFDCGELDYPCQVLVLRRRLVEWRHNLFELLTYIFRQFDVFKPLTDQVLAWAERVLGKWLVEKHRVKEAVEDEDKSDCELWFWLMEFKNHVAFVLEAWQPYDCMLEQEWLVKDLICFHSILAEVGFFEGGLAVVEHNAYIN